MCEFVRHWTKYGATAFLSLAVIAGCSQNATAPTPPPPPPPPVANAPSLTCGADVSTSTVNASGMAVTFAAPDVANGQSPVNVTCSPNPGTTFPIGVTEVNCTATDALNRSASCSFFVRVAKIPQLSRQRFLAFGDSITAGEVTVPITSINGFSLGATKQVQVPAAAYPTVLAKQLQARYTAQADNIVVANYGMGGERVNVARNRYFNALSVVRPDAVLLMDGYNDIARGENGAASSAAAEMRIWAAEARVRGMRVFIATPVPGLPGRSRTIENILLVDWANRMRDLAAQEGAVLVDLYGAMLPDAFRYIGVDGLHPNEAGYARIAELFNQAIQATLEMR